MAMSLVQMKAEFPTDPMKQRLVDQFLTETVILPRLNFVDASDALGYNFTTDDDGGDVSERSLNDQYADSAAASSTKTEKLSLFGGAIKTDQVIIDAKGDVARLSSIDRRMKRAGRYFDKLFFHGGEIGTVQRRAKQLIGLRTRCVLKNRVLWAGANGGALTQDLLDQGLDIMSGDPTNTTIFSSRPIRRKVTNLLRAAAGGKGIPDSATQTENYNGAKIVTVVEDEARQPIFGFNEIRGNSNVTQSLYMVRFGSSDDGDQLQGIRGPSFMKLRSPVNMGEYVKDVVDNVLGIADFTPFCILRIGGILDV